MREELWKRVENIQRDFEYRALHTDNNQPLQAWRVGNPNTINYSFEIIIGQSGMYVNGDIGPLSWRVCRNIGFLAGNDIGYYIHSKLEHDFLNQRDFSEDKRDSYILQEMSSYLEEAMEDYKYGQDIKKVVTRELGYTDSQVLMNPDLEEKVELAVEEKFNELYEALRKANQCDLTLEQMVDIYHEIGFDSEFKHKGWEIYTVLHGITELEELYNAIGNLDIYFDYDWDFTEASESVMFRLYMVCYAARKIVEQEEQSSCTSPLMSSDTP